MPPPPPPTSTPTLQGRTLKESSTNQTISNPATTTTTNQMPSKLLNSNDNHNNNNALVVSTIISDSLKSRFEGLSKNPQISTTNGVASSNPATIKTEITEKAETVNSNNNLLTLSTREKQAKKCPLKMSKLQERRRRQLQQQHQQQQNQQQQQHQQREQQQHQQREQQQQQHQDFSTVNNNNCNKHVTTVGCDKRCCPAESSSHQNGKFRIPVKIVIIIINLDTNLLWFEYL
jgi:hypothetical protein